MCPKSILLPAFKISISLWGLSCAFRLVSADYKPISLRVSLYCLSKVFLFIIYSLSKCWWIQSLIPQFLASVCDSPWLIFYGITSSESEVENFKTKCHRNLIYFFLLSSLLIFVWMVSVFKRWIIFSASTYMKSWIFERFNDQCWAEKNYRKSSSTMIPTCIYL